jgi:hypothetical protein
MFGGGFRNPQMAAMRFGLLFVVLIAGVVFHGSGSTYGLIRGVYLVVVLGGLFYGLSRRRGRFGGGMPPRGSWPNGPVDVRARENVQEPAPLSPAGWFPDPTDSKVERYWDGANWGASRQRDASGSIDG